MLDGDLPQFTFHYVNYLLDSGTDLSHRNAENVHELTSSFLRRRRQKGKH